MYDMRVVHGLEMFIYLRVYRMLISLLQLVIQLYSCLNYWEYKDMCIDETVNWIYTEIDYFIDNYY